MNEKVKDSILELEAKQSPKRRSAAKRLRKVQAAEAGPALLTALEKEVRDPRTWETQYQLIMALGECRYAPALLALERLAASHFDATMVYVAIGDAIVRLAKRHEHDVARVLQMLRDSKNSMLIDGALRGMAMLRMVPSTDEIGVILAFVRPLESTDPLRFWVAAAAPGWEHPELEAFLVTCETSGRDDLVNAARQVRARKYEKWNPI